MQITMERMKKFGIDIKKHFKGENYNAIERHAIEAFYHATKQLPFYWEIDFNIRGKAIMTH